MVPQTLISMEDSVTEAPHPAFGVPWAARGEERPSRFRTPLSWVDGHDGGVLFVKYDHIGEPQWIPMSEWNAWVKHSSAAPVKPEPPGEPPFDEGDGA
jgi:hypothetical protein